VKEYTNKPDTQSSFAPPAVQLQTRPFAPPQIQQSPLPQVTDSSQVEQGLESKKQQFLPANYYALNPSFSGNGDHNSTKSVMQRKWEGIVQRVKEGRIAEHDPSHTYTPMNGSPESVMQRKGLEIAQRLRETRAKQRQTEIQAKLAIGAVGDKYEQEADRVASQVVQTINSPLNPSQNVQRHEEDEELQMKPAIASLQRDTFLEEEEELQMKPLSIQREPEEEELQMKPDISSIQRHAGHEEEELQTKSLVQRQNTYDGGEASADLESSIQSARSSGQALDPDLQAKMGKAMGADFSGVRVHTDSQSDQLNKSIQAKAFTTGQDLFFRQGAYDPGSRGGQELIAHELTHVVQQNGGAVQRHQDEEELQMKPVLQRQESSATCTAGCQCVSCMPTNATVQRKINISDLNGSQNLLSRKLSDMVQQEGAPIQRFSDAAAHGNSCPCPDCGSTGMHVQRQSDTAHGAGCSCPTCSHEKIQTKPMVQRHLAEDVSTHITPTIRQSANRSTIQRHSSWEHQLLGDAQPTDLAKIGVWQELIEQTKLEGFLGFRKRKKEKAEIDIEGVGKINKGNVMHVIAQELQRLDQWQKNPPQKASSGEIDPTYQTVLVAIPGGGKDGESPLVITYGEMNTLADYYGSVDVMKTADPKVRWEVIQSVRKETFLKLSEIYSQLKSSLTDQEKTGKDVTDSEKMMSENETENTFLNRNKFADAFEADLISGKKGQITLLKLGGAGATGTNEYSATLARNACHFAPESWHAWASYHEKALTNAEVAWNLKKLANKYSEELGSKDPLDRDVEDNTENLKKDLITANQVAEEEANEAILNNGFGDHYLQDSYAAGHMINKTKIMQWFVQWLDTQKYSMDFSTDENWRKVQAIAYKQPEIASAMQYDKTQVQGYDEGQKTNRAQNPQAVEDMDGSWQERFNALGLQVPKSLQTPGTPSRILMEWWQTLTGNGGGRELTGEDLSKCKLDFEPLKLALRDLISDGIVYLTNLSAAETGEKILSGKRAFNTSQNFEGFKLTKFALRKEYVPRNMEKFIQARDSHKNEVSNYDDSQYQSMAAAVTYQDYMMFMNNAYVQKSTNALHDVFCLKGLEVSSGEGEKLFKVYGDDSMFNSGSAAGVKHSGETAKMSLNSIRSMIQTGKEGANTTQAILNRLPNQVKPPGGNFPAISIQAWHDPSQVGNLKKYCEDNIFPNMGVIDKFVGATGDLTNFISKDKAAVHGSDAF
jgi:hypothetical protein